MRRFIQVLGILLEVVFGFGLFYLVYLYKSGIVTKYAVYCSVVFVFLYGIIIKPLYARKKKKAKLINNKVKRNEDSSKFDYFDE